MQLFHRLRAFINHHPELDNGKTWIVGVSGGPDSLTLLHLLRRLARDGFVPGPAGGAPPFVAAHLDHGLRSASADEAAFVARTAAEWDIPFASERVDVAALAAEQRRSQEEAGRHARYRFFAHVAAKFGAGAVLVGHNADDQSETVLMHVIRGSGLGGLRGMPPVAPLSALGIPNLQAPDGLLLARPLLDVSRAEIEQYCERHGLQPRRDESNADPGYTRNRIRNEILPVVERLNPNVRPTLRRMATVAAADHAVVQQATDRAWQAHARVDAGSVSFDRAGFRDLLPGLRHALLRRAVLRLRPHAEVNSACVLAAAQLGATGQAGQQADLTAGLLLHVSYEEIYIAAEHSALPLPTLAAGRVVNLPIPGQVEVGESGWRANTRLAERTQLTADSGKWTALLDIGRLARGVTLRTRRPGDRFQPLGLHGHSQSIADFMINARIPVKARDSLPLVVCDDEIAWLPGWRLDHRFRVTEETKQVARIRFIPPERDT